MSKQMKMETRVMAGFGALVLLAIAMGAVALLNLSSMNTHWREFESVTLAKKDAVLAGGTALSDTIHHFKNYILRGGDYDKQFAADLAAMEKVVGDYRAAGTASPEEQNLLGEILAGANAYREAMAQLAALREKGAAATDMDKAIAGADKPIGTAFEKLLVINGNETKAKSAQMTGALETAWRWIGSVGVLVLLAGVMLALWIIRPARSGQPVANHRCATRSKA